MAPRENESRLGKRERSSDRQYDNGTSQTQPATPTNTPRTFLGDAINRRPRRRASRRRPHVIVAFIFVEVDVVGGRTDEEVGRPHVLRHLVGDRHVLFEFEVLADESKFGKCFPKVNSNSFDDILYLRGEHKNV